MPPRDIENVTSLKGFALVAAKIASDADKTTTIYRRFDELSARSLLYYQAQIAELDVELKEYDNEDCHAKDTAEDDEVVESLKDWSVFERRAEEGVIRDNKKMELVVKIREKLEKYHAALCAHQTLLNAQPPSPSTVEALKAWFINVSDTGKAEPEALYRLWGASEHTFSNIHDLVALRVPADQDRLSNFVTNHLSFLFHSSHSSNSKSKYISERSVARFVAVLSTILAAIMLFGAIISLYVVKNPNALLGMLSGWTVLFAACVGLLTNAKRDQIFGVTAAYAAVLVVFVSGNLGNAPSGNNCTSTVTP